LLILREIVFTADFIDNKRFLGRARGHEEGPHRGALRAYPHIILSFLGFSRLLLRLVENANKVAALTRRR